MPQIGESIMGYPVSYFDIARDPATPADEAVAPIEHAAGSAAYFEQAERFGLTRAEAGRAILALQQAGLVATLECQPFPGQVARIKIDAYGESASEVEATLREFASRADSASQSSECSYGQFVIERNVDVVDGDLYSWKGRLTLHPGLGREPYVPAGKLREALDD